MIFVKKNKRTVSVCRLEVTVVAVVMATAFCGIGRDTGEEATVVEVDETEAVPATVRRRRRRFLNDFQKIRLLFPLRTARLVPLPLPLPLPPSSLITSRRVLPPEFVAGTGEKVEEDVEEEEEGGRTDCFSHARTVASVTP